MKGCQGFYVKVCEHNNKTCTTPLDVVRIEGDYSFSTLVLNLTHLGFQMLWVDSRALFCMWVANGSLGHMEVEPIKSMHCWYLIWGCHLSLLDLTVKRTPDRNLSPGSPVFLGSKVL